MNSKKIRKGKYVANGGFKMKVVLLAGGYGTRISEESHLRPKPMIEIGGQPILWHIMKSVSYTHLDVYKRQIILEKEPCSALSGMIFYIIKRIGKILIL